MTSIYQIDESTTLADIRKAGETLGQEMGQQAKIDADLYDDADDAIYDALEDSGEAWANFTCMSPFEMVASALNKRDDSEEAWQELEESFSESYAEAIEARKGKIQEDINERIFDEECDKVRKLWPEIKKMVISQYSADDEVAIDEEFNNWTDSLCKDGQISSYTYENITREEVE